MRFALLLIVALTGIAVACTSSSGEGATVSPVPDEPEAVSGVTPTALVPPTPLVSLLWTGEGVIDEIAAQLFDEASRPVHIFGLNVEDGEEFVPSGRDVLPIPPNTFGWRAEFEGDGVWIVDTGELIYRFTEADTRFDVIHVYAGE